MWINVAVKTLAQLKTIDNNPWFDIPTLDRIRVDVQMQSTPSPAIAAKIFYFALSPWKCKQSLEERTQSIGNGARCEDNGAKHLPENTPSLLAARAISHLRKKLRKKRLFAVYLFHSAPMPRENKNNICVFNGRYFGGKKAKEKKKERTCNQTRGKVGCQRKRGHECALSEWTLSIRETYSRYRGESQKCDQGRGERGNESKGGGGIRLPGLFSPAPYGFVNPTW